MATTGKGEIIGAAWDMGPIPIAAKASGGAGGINAQVGPFKDPIRLKHAYWTPTAADQVATKTSSYRQLFFQDAGVDGKSTATAGQFGTLNLNVSKPQWGPVPITLPTPTPAYVLPPTPGPYVLPAGNVLQLWDAVVGGAEANGTVLVAGQLTLDYETL